MSGGTGRAGEGSVPSTARMIYEAAMGCFERGGFAATSVEEIAQAAGVSRMTVFRHFGRKEDIVFAGSDRRLQALGSLLAQSRPETPDGLYRCVVDFAGDLASAGDFGRWMGVIDGDRDLLARAGLLRWDMESVVSVGLAEARGLDAPNLALRVLATSAVGALFMAARESFNGDGDFVSLTREALREAGIPTRPTSA